MSKQLTVLGLGSFVLGEWLGRRHRRDSGARGGSRLAALRAGRADSSPVLVGEAVNGDLARSPRIGHTPTPVLTLRHNLEFFLLRAAFWGFDLLPTEGASWLAMRGADLWWLADARRRRVAMSNILRCGIEDDPVRARALSRRSAEHFAKVVVESLKSGEILDEGSWRDAVRLDIHPEVEAVLEDPERGLIMASGHFGNWEIAAQILSRWKPVAGITRTMNNPKVDELIQQRKPRYDFRPIQKYDANPGRFVELLGQGEILALLTDQYARSRGAQIPFFGHPASTHTTAAMLHLVTRTPLCFGACRRVGPMRFELTTSPLITTERSGDRKRDVAAILETLNGHLEAAIRRDPDQYLWGHRRWRDQR